MNFHTKEIGLSFALCGISMGTFSKVVLGVNLVYPLMVLSAILLFNYNIFTTGFRNIHNLHGYKTMLFFLLLMFGFGWFYNNFNPFVNRNFMPMCFAVVICLELFTQDKRTDFKNFILILYVISAIGCLFALVARTQGFIGFGDINDVTHDYNSRNDDSAVFLFADIGLINLAANLNFKTHNKILGISRFIMAIISFLLVLTSGKRTVTILFFLYIALWLYEHCTWKEIKEKFYVIIPYLILLIIIIAFISRLGFVKDFFNSFQERFVTGVNIIFGGATNVYEDSASTRLVMRQRFDQMVNSPDFGLLNFLFGKGWMTLYMDCPILESFLDMGIVGFILFTYNYIVREVVNIFTKRKIKSELYLFGCMIALNPLVSVYHAGIPYAPNYLVPISIMILFKNLSCNNNLTT